MIWTTGPTGDVYYVAPEWTEFTGQCESDAKRDGWLGALHPEDRKPVVEAFSRACSENAAFTVSYRLQRADGVYARVVSGATPSFSPVDGSFLGFLGSVTEISEAVREVQGRRLKGRLILLTPDWLPAPKNLLAALASHVLLARASAERLGENELLSALDVALSVIFVRFGTSTQRH